jgi:cytochrome c oxidase subunit I+III
MGSFCIARQVAGRLGASHRATFDNTRLLWLYTCGQGLAAQLL